MNASANVTAPSLWNTARSRFGSWDGDHNGFLTDGEVEGRLRTDGLSAEEKAALETFRGRQSGLQKAHRDEFLWERKGTTLEDLDAYRASSEGRRLEEQFRIEHGLATETRTAVDPDRPADLSDKVGTREYYVERYRDFRRRNPDEKAPDYYLNYGVKYFDRFNARKGDLQPVSQAWVDRTARSLQEKMETRARNPEDFAQLERDPEAFKAFAYGSHPAAYLESGLQQVPWGDRVRIGLTPDASDLLTPDGINQAVKTGVSVLAQDFRSWLA